MRNGFSGGPSNGEREKQMGIKNKVLCCFVKTRGNVIKTLGIERRWILNLLRYDWRLLKRLFDALFVSIATNGNRPFGDGFSCCFASRSSRQNQDSSHPF